MCLDKKGLEIGRWPMALGDDSDIKAQCSQTIGFPEKKATQFFHDFGVCLVCCGNGLGSSHGVQLGNNPGWIWLVCSPAFLSHSWLNSKPTNTNPLRGSLSFILSGIPAFRLFRNTVENSTSPTRRFLTRWLSLAARPSNPSRYVKKPLVGVDGSVGSMAYTPVTGLSLGTTPSIRWNQRGWWLVDGDKMKIQGLTHGVELLTPTQMATGGCQMGRIQLIPNIEHLGQNLQASAGSSAEGFVRLSENREPPFILSMNHHFPYESGQEVYNPCQSVVFRYHTPIEPHWYHVVA